MRLRGLTPLLALLCAGPALAGPDGAAVYKRCAACHLPTGAGVPGAYPKLGANFQAHAASPAGRDYLVLVVSRGVTGPVTVEGKSYQGFMPAQTLDDESIAAVLNHIGASIAKPAPGFRPFSATEVAAARAAGAKLSAASVGKLRPQAVAR
ncbi:MAG: cytochrome c [Phenylobacterium sp.]|uniref:c-type cytochrome n=1 Tax=Phenylobacterium sp. TaxID=1871053 RepID=UPI001A181283|nr:cytochrome c [Phenylobacterium sp.]MBJ7408786.1 cytochrome c [Phenylobacterium sp.]